MDLENIKVWLQAINMLGTFALGVWLYLEKRSDKTNDRVGALEWENVLLQARLRQAESQLAQVVGSRSESASN